MGVNIPTEILMELNDGIGWRGHGTDPDIFYCEFCGMSDEDYTKIKHDNTCLVFRLRVAVLISEGIDDK